MWGSPKSGEHTVSFSRKRSPAPQPPVLAAKWPGRMLDEGFAPLPKRLLRCMGKVFGGPHAIDEFRVIMAIVDYIRPDLYRWPSYEYLAFVAGMSKHKFTERLKAMQERQWLEVDDSDVRQVRISIAPFVRVVEQLTDDDLQEAEDIE